MNMSVRAKKRKQGKVAVAYAFTSSRLQPLGEFVAIRQLIRDMLLGIKVGGKAAAFAAPAFPSTGRQFVDLDVGIYEEDDSPKVVGKIGDKFKKDTLLANVTNYLIEPRRISAALRGRLFGELLKKTFVSNRKRMTFYWIEDPVRYKGYYKNRFREPPKFHVILPFFIGHRLVATVGLDIPELDDTVTAHIKTTLSALRDVVAKIYYTYHAALDQASRSSVHDTYSSLVSRRYYNEIMKPRNFGRWLEPSPKCLFVYFDGNGVKKINDKYHHGFGDRAIEHYAGSICQGVESVIREQRAHHGFVAKWGGDEFIAVLALGSRAKEAEVAAVLGERVQKALARTQRNLSQIRPMLGLAGGWTVWKGARNAASAVDAENAMYFCKRLLKALQERMPQEKFSMSKRPAVALLGFGQVSDLRETLLQKLGVMMGKIVRTIKAAGGRARSHFNDKRMRRR